jgi:septum formation protein
MLRALSGKTHQVITGVTLATTTFQKSFASVSQVTFATLSDEEIKYYISHYHPMDKAGSYGVQEWIGFIGVERIEGSYFNVMGLPVQRLYRELISLNR